MPGKFEPVGENNPTKSTAKSCFQFRAWMNVFLMSICFHDAVKHFFAQFTRKFSAVLEKLRVCRHIFLPGELQPANAKVATLQLCLVQSMVSSGIKMSSGDNRGTNYYLSSRHRIRRQKPNSAWRRCCRLQNGSCTWQGRILGSSGRNCNTGSWTDSRFVAVSNLNMTVKLGDVFKLRIAKAEENTRIVQELDGPVKSWRVIVRALKLASVIKLIRIVNWWWAYGHGNWYWWGAIWRKVNGALALVLFGLHQTGVNLKWPEIGKLFPAVAYGLANRKFCINAVLFGLYIGMCLMAHCTNWIRSSCSSGRSGCDRKWYWGCQYSGTGSSVIAGAGAEKIAKYLNNKYLLLSKNKYFTINSFILSQFPMRSQFKKTWKHFSTKCAA